MIYTSLQKTVIGLCVLLWLGGCGGSSGGTSGSTGNMVQIVTDADAIAYQRDDESWSENPTFVTTHADGQKEYRFEQTGRYGVALYCKQQNYMIIFQLHSNESRKVAFTCAHPDSTAKLAGTVKDTTDTPDAIAVAMGHAYQIVYTNGGNYAIDPLKGVRDLVAISLKSINNKTIPQKLYIERGISLLADNTAHNITLTAANTVSLEGHRLDTVNNTNALSMLVTANDTLATAAIDGNWYLPKSGLITEDMYAFYAFNLQNKIAMLEIHTATKVTHEDRTLDVSYIPLLAGVTYDNSATFANLHYQTNAQTLPLRAYLITLEAKNGTHMELVLSAKWLADQETYTIPDIKKLQTFQNAWTGKQAQSAEIKALMSNRTIGDMFTTQRFLRLDENDYFLLPESRYEMAGEKIF